MVDTNPFDAIKNELTSRGRQNAHLLGILQFDWPAAELIIEKLSCYVTDGIKPDQVPIIYPIIEEALRRYGQLIFHEQKHKCDDPVRIGAFLETLITETCRALTVRVVDSETSLRGLVYESITCESVKTVLRRTNYEDAVVTGCMAVSH